MFFTHFIFLCFAFFRPSCAVPPPGNNDLRSQAYKLIFFERVIDFDRQIYGMLSGNIAPGFTSGVPEEFMRDATRRRLTTIDRNPDYGVFDGTDWQRNTVHHWETNGYNGWDGLISGQALFPDARRQTEDDVFRRVRDVVYANQAAMDPTSFSAASARENLRVSLDDFYINRMMAIDSDGYEMAYSRLMAALPRGGQMPEEIPWRWRAD